MISHEKKLIFIHIPRTGGTTFSKFLRPYCDDESLRFSPYDAPDVLREDHRQHAPIYEYYEYYGTKHVSDYKIVSICRNPWDKAVSMYRYHNKEDKEFDPDKFTEMLVAPHAHHLEPHSHFFFWQQIRIGDLSGICDGGWFHRNNPRLKTFVDLGCFRIPDHRLVFENYAYSVMSFFDEFDIKYNEEELKTKTNASTHTHYSDYHTTASEQFVGSTCQLDLVKGTCTPQGYKFESQSTLNSPLSLYGKKS